MLEIKKVANSLEANQCDELLTKLIQEERKYDNNIKSTFVVKDNYKKIFDKNYNALFIAILNEKVIGYIYGYLENRAGEFVSNSTALIDALYVDENCRDKGIGTKLMDRFYKWCKQQNITIVEITVFSENKKTLSIYERFGFQTHTFRMSKNI